MTVSLSFYRINFVLKFTCRVKNNKNYYSADPDDPIIYKIRFAQKLFASCLPDHNGSTSTIDRDHTTTISDMLHDVICI